MAADLSKNVQKKYVNGKSKKLRIVAATHNIKELAMYWKYLCSVFARPMMMCGLVEIIKNNNNNLT